MNNPLPTRRQRRDLSAALDHLGSQRPARISIADDRFTKYDANGQQIGQQALFLDVVICDVQDVKGKMYYGHKYSPGNDSPPKCWSDNGKAPSAQAIEPQAPTCGQCWWNVQGSHVNENGVAVKACRDQQKLAVFCMNGDELDQPPLAYELVVPPASLTNLRQYRDHLATMPPAVAGRKHAGVDDVITRLTVEQKRIGFAAIAQAAGDDEIEDRFELLTVNGATDKLVGRGDQPIPAGAPTAGMLVEGQGQPVGQLTSPYNSERPQVAYQAPVAPQMGLHQVHTPAYQQNNALAAPVAPQAPAPAPQVPFAPVGSPPTSQSTAAGNGSVTTASPSKRGRPKAPEVIPPQTTAPFTPPAFLQQQGQAAPAQAAFGAAPPPPAAIAEGLAKAMSLPTRRKAE